MSESFENIGEKYAKICKQNKQMDLVGYFKGIQSIENEEHKMTGLLLIISLLLIAISFSIPRDNPVDAVIAFVFLVIGVIAFMKTLQSDRKYIEVVLKKRVNEEDTNKLVLLRNNGEKTKIIVDKILSEHNNGFLTYEAIAKHLEELVVVYNVERSQRLNKIFEENGGKNGT